MLTFSQWLAINKYEEKDLPETQRKHLEAAWKAEVAASNPPPPVPTKQPDPKPNGFDSEMHKIEAEAGRLEHIEKETLRYCHANIGNPQKIEQLKLLAQAAKDDKAMSAKDFDNAMLRADHRIGIMVTTPRAEQATDDVIEAAICRTHGLKDMEKRFSERTLEASDKRFRGGLTLVGLMTLAARQNGYKGEILGKGNLLPIWQAAQRGRMSSQHEMMAESGLSTLSIPGILSNTANKFLTTQFLYGEQSWRRIAKIKTANDFKTMTTYRLTGSNKFIKVPPGGEIKHGTLSELTYTNIVDTYGILLGIDRRDFINDDLSALTGRADEIGIGAIDSLNEVFWTEWLDDSDFFNTDKSRNNYDDGATDSVLSLAGLDNADNIFAAQTKPNGSPLGVQPRLLLVPRALRNTARNLMAAAPTASAQSTATVTLQNVWSGEFDIVDTVYLQSSAITGYSSTAWYLLADPMNLAAIEAAFLFGKQEPTVEESELEFDRLGMSMRAYMDWGCNKQEPRAGVKLKGAA